MPTKLRTIVVPEDPDLAEALARAAKELPGLSEAALVKELALRGARTLRPTDPDERISRIIARTGAQPARADIQSYLRENPPGPVDPAEPTPGTNALQEQRAERL
jgi:hypothetical protein